MYDVRYVPVFQKLHSFSNLGSVSDTHTMIPFSSSTRFLTFRLMAVIDEKLNTRKYGIAHAELNTYQNIALSS